MASNPGPKAKSKAKGVSASSFFDLKAELSKKEQEFAKSKAAGSQSYVVGGVQRPDKKPTVWTRQNKGLDARASRDVQLEAVSRPTLESARAALERKARIYDKLKKGKTGGLSDGQYDALLVDFDAKRFDTGKGYDSDSDDVDESLEVPQPPSTEADDPIVEYEDEFGRLRTARRSEVPRNLVPEAEGIGGPEFDEDIIIRNPVNHFPIYTPDASRLAAIAAAQAEADTPLDVHYDAAREVRAKGAGFYQFSGDEETRRKQMDELKAAREETGKARKETGALDVIAGEVEGMGSGVMEEGKGTSRSMEKRKREMEERRKMIEAKRRKIGHITEEPVSASQPGRQPTDKRGEGGEGSAVTSLTSVHEPPRGPVANDPFAALEATSTVPSRTNSGKFRPPPQTQGNEADAFLAQLKREFVGNRKKGGR